MSTASPVPVARPRTPLALYALTIGAFGIGTTEFVIMGLLMQVAADLQVTIAAAGLLISGYALGVFVGAPLLTAATSRMPRKAALVALMVVFTLGNLACALAPDYTWLMVARVVTSLAHGTFFGVGAVVATGLVAEDRKASAISIMFTGLTVATLLGVPAGAWFGLHFGWRSTFWAVVAIGVLATAVIAALVPRDRAGQPPVSMREEVRVLGRVQVLLGLLATVVGYAGVFAVFTYIQPILTRITGFADSAVSPILLVFGVGMIAGNLIGGKLADRRLVPTLLGSLAVLALVLGLMTFALHSKPAAVLFTGLLGAAAFATVAPLQLRVLRKAEGGGQSLASSFNIAAFNLGNAIGAWLGGAVIDHGPGLAAVTWVAALVTVLGLAIAAWSVRLDRQPRVSRRPVHGAAAVLLLVGAIFATTPAQASEVPDRPAWTATWTASPQPLWEGDFALPVNVPGSLWNQTVRQVARVSVGGDRVRVRLSNEYGTTPLHVGAARIALAGDGVATVPGSSRALTFGGKASITIPPGAPAVSDPVALDVAALASLSVSLYLPRPTAVSTFHWDARQTAYVMAGDQVAADAPVPDSTLSARVFLTSILVERAAPTRTVVALGDSITDGATATMDADTRWPDFLAERLVDDDIAVLNAGISGGRLLRDKMGSNALARFERDVLAQPGIAAVIVLIGINDISWNAMVFAPHDDPVAATEVIAGYRQLIARAKLHGVRIVGATLLPFGGALQDTPMAGYFSAEKEQVRQAVNRWIRDSGEFDAVVDFDAVMRDPARPSRLLPAYDSGDHLHPGDAGNQAMAEAIDIDALLGSH